MKTKITPHGTMIQIEHKDKTYFGLLIVDFDLYKTFGNYDIEIDSLTLFDEDYDKIPYWEPIYDELSPIVEKIVLLEENDEDEEEDE